MTHTPNAEVKIIAVAEFWEQPPIETSAHRFIEAKVFFGDTEAAVIWEWAINQATDYVKLSSLKITREKP